MLTLFFMNVSAAKALARYAKSSDSCTFFLFFLCDAKRKERRVPKKEKKKPLWGIPPHPHVLSKRFLCRPWHGCEDAKEEKSGALKSASG